MNAWGGEANPSFFTPERGVAAAVAVAGGEALGRRLVDVSGGRQEGPGGLWRQPLRLRNFPFEFFCDLFARNFPWKSSTEYLRGSFLWKFLCVHNFNRVQDPRNESTTQLTTEGADCESPSNGPKLNVIVTFLNTSPSGMMRRGCWCKGGARAHEVP